MSELKGSHIGQNGELENACVTIDSLNCSDLLSLLTLMSHHRSKDVKVESVVGGNRFNQPSKVSQRDFHKIEGHIFDQLPEVEFIELSVLQPFGINTVLADTNEKNVVAALRRSEVNADATTALFRVALQRFRTQKPIQSSTIRLASNSRITRAQVFDPATKFLPHFKVFGEVTVGRQSEKFGEEELLTLIGHLKSELQIINVLDKDTSFSIADYGVSISNVLLMQGLMDRGVVSQDELRRNTANPNYDAFVAAGLNIPPELPFDTPEIGRVLRSYGFERGVKVTEVFQALVAENVPELMPILMLDLRRIAGIGYYRHLCYHITAQNEQGEVLPIGDGGSTDWMEKVTGRKDLYCVSSGIGTELLGQYFIR